MFEFTESIAISRHPTKIWDCLVDVEKWWPPSNPEHIGIEVRSSGKPIGVGTEITFKERVGGIEGCAAGSITSWVTGREATWEGEAVYRYRGIPIRIVEGVCWSIQERGSSSMLSARVWAKFPETVFGCVLEWYAVNIMNIVDRDRAHARCELEYLKGVIEGASS